MNRLPRVHVALLLELHMYAVLLRKPMKLVRPRVHELHRLGLLAHHVTKLDGGYALTHFGVTYLLEHHQAELARLKSLPWTQIHHSIQQFSRGKPL